MKPRNYFVHAMEGMLDWERMFAGTGDPRDLRTAEELRLVRRGMERSAVCWHIDDIVLPMLWHTHLDADTLGSLRMPYRCLAIEYDFRHKLLGLPSPDPATGRDEAAPRVTILTELVNMNRPGDRSFAGISVHNFFRDSREPAGRWSVTPYFTFISYDELHEWTLNDRTKRVPAKLQGLCPSMSLEVLAQRMGTTEEALVERFTKQSPMVDDIRVALALMALLSCNNVPTRVIEPSARLNRKRAKRGHAPIPTYRVVHLERSERRLYEHALRGGTHASPRPHVRRGFLRNQWYARAGLHKLKWVRPTFVGGSRDAKPIDLEVRP